MKLLTPHPVPVSLQRRDIEEELQHLQVDAQVELLKTHDTLAYGAGTGVAILAALAAAYFPSLRAAQVDPASALRCD